MLVVLIPRIRLIIKITKLIGIYIRVSVLRILLGRKYIIVKLKITDIKKIDIKRTDIKRTDIKRIDIKGIIGIKI